MQNKVQANIVNGVGTAYGSAAHRQHPPTRKMMEYRFAKTSDIDRLAEWNHQLIQDEGHRNAMTVAELRERMQTWLCAEYKAVLFGPATDPVAYALYKENTTEVYLRQLFVQRDRRSEGIGHAAVNMLRSQIWPRDKRLTVEVLIANKRAVEFWRSVGYQDYCLTLEIMPKKGGETAATGDADNLRAAES